ncbi:MAG: orotidine-5'-phosphate decarboxylase [Planctomycetota bacterium]|nr:orotidine-5'-phosphate decarboxylase [Planctomycetota bacterium]
MFSQPRAHAEPSTINSGPSPAVLRLAASARARSSLLSLGLEPCRGYLPRGFEPTIPGYARFLESLIDATSDIAAAFKFNLAFFESLGSQGAGLLERIRAHVPRDSFVIADAKRSDIGSTAEHYATALYDRLAADSATVNPLMGRDACEPFLAHADKLTFFLVLTSNPGAADFLLPGGLFRAIASAVESWNTRGNAGAVVGATKPEQVSELRALMPRCPFLIPGIGAQGGDLQAVAAHGPMVAGPDGFNGLLFHVTRGVLPAADETGDPIETIRAKALAWRDRINAAAGVPQRRTDHVAL